MFNGLTLLLSQFAFAIQILGEGLPLHGVLLDIGLRALVADELGGIAVVQVVAGIVGILANHGIVQHEVVEYATVYVGYEAADLEQYVLAEVELQLLFIIVLHQFRVKLLVLLLEANFAGADVEPLYVVLGEEGVDDGSRAPCLAARLADEEPGLLYGVCRKRLVLLVVAVAA